MRQLSTRTAGFTDSVIRRMTRISNKYGAINLSQGFPDFDPPKEITDRLAEIAPRGPHQYAITWGAQNFREALAELGFELSWLTAGRRQWHPLQSSCLENPMGGGAWWAAVHGVAKSRTRLSDFTFTLHFHALEKEMATHSSVLAWRIPGTGEPGGLLSVGSRRVGHD